MSKIENLEKKLHELKVKQASEIAELMNEVRDLKKKDEVKPVFPDDANSVRLNILTYKEDCALGLSAYDAAGLGRIMTQLKARAYVIEAINKANGGDNGFKVGEENYCLTYLHDEKCFRDYINERNQTQDGEFYFRDLTVMIKLVKCSDFITAFKAMRGIK